tara:strand:+ start:1985 stop:2803 length:819 start_codon:yes stop_codon:yes gene_type:complete
MKLTKLNENVKKFKRGLIAKRKRKLKKEKEKLEKNCEEYCKKINSITAERILEKIPNADISDIFSPKNLKRVIADKQNHISHELQNKENAIDEKSIRIICFIPPDNINFKKFNKKGGNLLKDSYRFKEAITHPSVFLDIFCTNSNKTSDFFKTMLANNWPFMEYTQNWWPHIEIYLNIKIINEGFKLGEDRKEHEKLGMALENNNNNIIKAAKSLKLTKSQFIRKLKKYREIKYKYYTKKRWPNGIENPRPPLPKGTMPRNNRPKTKKAILD